MAQNPKASQNNLALFAVISLSILLLVVLIINIGRGSPESESVDEETQTNQEDSQDGESADGGDESDSIVVDTQDNQDDSPVIDPAEDQEEVLEGLPINWHSLSSAEKTALNPFDCPVDDEGIIRLSAETGECLEVQEDEGGDEDEGESVDIPDDALVVSLGEAFRYDDSSEISVTGLSCTNLEFVVIDPYNLNLTLGQVLSQRADDYEAYKADSYTLTGDYFDRNEDLSYLNYFEYLQGFERWRDANVSSLASDDLAEQLFNYLDCEIYLTLKNIGEDSSFSDGCGWDFDDPISLIGEQQVYGQENRDQLLIGIACTQAEVDFPTGATDGDTLSFIVSSEDAILEIVLWGAEDTFRVVLDRN